MTKYDSNYFRHLLMCEIRYIFYNQYISWIVNDNGSFLVYCPKNEPPDKLSRILLFNTSDRHTLTKIKLVRLIIISELNF